MCFSSGYTPQPATTPAAPPPAPSPLAVATDPNAPRTAEDIAQYGPGGQPNLRRIDPSTTSGGVGAGKGGVSVPTAGTGLGPM